MRTKQAHEQQIQFTAVLSAGQANADSNVRTLIALVQQRRKDSARTHCCSTTASNHTGATMIHMTWREKHLWNINLLQRVHLFNLVLCFRPVHIFCNITISRSRKSTYLQEEFGLYWVQTKLIYSGYRPPLPNAIGIEYRRWWAVLWLGRVVHGWTWHPHCMFLHALS
jgi:hypothetical protein